MSLLQTVNDLRGAMTYGDAQQALSVAYAELTEHPNPQSAEAARQVNAFRNKLGGKTVRRAWDFGGDAAGTVSQDQALTETDRAKMENLANQLEKAQLPGGGGLDPEAKVSFIEEYKGEAAFAGFGIIVAIVLGFFLAFRR
jgi:hypothetical protein